MNVIVRIYVPDNGSWNGHYDIYIDGSYNIGSVNVNRKVLSYAPMYNHNRQIVSEGTKTKGCLYIFNPTDTKNVLYGCNVAGSCTGYTFTFNASESLVTGFAQFMTNYLGNSYGTTGLQYHVNGPFKYYSEGDHNCFRATAIWCQKLGYSTLLDIYNRSQSFNDYLPKELYKLYGAYWTAVKRYIRQNDGTFNEVDP